MGLLWKRKTREQPTQETTSNTANISRSSRVSRISTGHDISRSSKSSKTGNLISNSESHRRISKRESSRYSRESVTGDYSLPADLLKNLDFNFCNKVNKDSKQTPIRLGRETRVYTTGSQESHEMKESISKPLVIKSPDLKGMKDSTRVSFLVKVLKGAPANEKRRSNRNTISSSRASSVSYHSGSIFKEPGSNIRYIRPTKYKNTNETPNEPVQREIIATQPAKKPINIPQKKTNPVKIDIKVKRDIKKTEKEVQKVKIVNSNKDTPDFNYREVSKLKVGKSKIDKPKKSNPGVRSNANNPGYSFAKKLISSSTDDSSQKSPKKSPRKKRQKKTKLKSTTTTNDNEFYEETEITEEQSTETSNYAIKSSEEGFLFKYDEYDNEYKVNLSELGKKISSATLFHTNGEENEENQDEKTENINLQEKPKKKRQKQTKVKPTTPPPLNKTKSSSKKESSKKSKAKQSRRSEKTLNVNIKSQQDTDRIPVKESSSTLMGIMSKMDMEQPGKRSPFLQDNEDTYTSDETFQFVGRKSSILLSRNRKSRDPSDGQVETELVSFVLNREIEDDYTEDEEVIEEEEEEEEEENVTELSELEYKRNSFIERIPCRKCKAKYRYSMRLSCKPGTEDLISDSPEISVSSSSIPRFPTIPDKESFELLIMYLIPSAVLTSIGMHVIPDLESHVEMYYKKTFVISWNFINYKESIRFELDDKEKLKIKYYKVYPFSISKTYYLYFLKCSIPLELYVLDHLESQKLLGKCEMKLETALKNIGQIMSGNLQINNKDIYLCSKKNVEPTFFGTLQCKFLFKGDIDKYKECEPEPLVLKMVPPLGTGSFTSLLGDYPQRHSSDLHLIYADVTDSEMAAFQDGLNLVLVRNKALRTTQAEICNELRERTTWMHEELKWRLTLQEHAILSGKDPNLVKWRQWKDDQTSKVKFRPLSHEDFVEIKTAVVDITIVDLILNADSFVATNEQITLIYIEYMFLHHVGRNMETESVRKMDDETPMFFDFKRTFVINKEEKDAKLLVDMIKGNDYIVFTVVWEPTEDENKIQACKELGSCYINIFNLVQTHKDTVEEYYEVIDELRMSGEIGKLKIRFSGIAAMRTLALNMLTPESFKILR